MRRCKHNATKQTRQMGCCKLKQKKKAGTNTALQADAEDSDAIDLACHEIGDFVSRHLLKRNMLWGLFVDTWEADGVAYQNMGEQWLQSCVGCCQDDSWKRKDWNEKMLKDLY